MSDSSQTKSEAASPRKRQQSRDQGQVASSNDFAAGIILTLLLLLMSYSSLALGRSLLDVVGRDLPAAVIRQDLAIEQGVAIGRASAMFLLKTTLILVAGGMLIAVGAHVSQVGFQIAPQAIALKPSRLSPAGGIKKIFSRRGFVRTGMAIGKFAACTAAISASCYFKLDELMMQSTSVAQGVAHTWDLCLHVAVLGALALVGIGAFDLAFQRWQHEDDLKMTRQEVKDEAKENEGDGQVKGKIRRLQSEAINQRSLNEVPHATVVITNPTHYAIAIRYDRDSMAAPRVVAKGKNLLAQRIKRLASESGVPQFEQKLVARSLYASTEVGSEIPADLYRGVAEILAYVYGLKR